MIKVTLEFTTIYAAAAALMTLQEAGHGAAIPADDKLPAASAPAAAKVVTGKQEPIAAASTGTPAGAQPASAGSAQTAEAGKSDAGAQPAASSAQTASSPKGDESPAQAASDATLSYEKDVKPVVIKVGAAGKRDALVELLKKFGVAKGPEVPAGKLPAFKNELEALLA